MSSILINPYSMGSADPYWNSVVFLAGYEGADGATSYSEEKNSRAATFFGNAQLDTAQKKFGVSSLLLDGSGDYLTYADHADWTPGATFTLEGWVRFNSVSGDQAFMSQWDGITGNASWWFALTGGSNLSYMAYNGGFNETSASWTPSTGVQYHVAVDRDGSNKVRVYADGVMKGSMTLTGTVQGSSNPMSVGRIDHPFPFYLNGWLDEWRYTQGVARYANDSGFTPPTAPFPRH
jgi:hypothetical protein